MPISFRITGPQSIERLEPLIPQVVADAVSVNPSAAEVDRQKLDFVWETTCEIAWRARHSEATVLNKLHNVVILEDKANFAFLQLRMNCPVLDTYVASSPQTVLIWAQAKWAAAPVSRDEGDWWVVKASAGNGGKDIWVMTCENYEKVVSDLPPDDTLVIQRYVPSLYLFIFIIA
jgi:glutathione synthase/RimK-type ligase-like ATP-grasp enzyme